MRPTQESFHNRFFYSGLTREVYRSIEKRLYYHNVKNLRDISVFAMTVGTVFTLLSVFRIVPQSYLPLYFYLTALSLTYFVIARKTIMVHQKLGRGILYTFITLSLLFADLLGIKYVVPGSLAVFFNVLIVLLPIIYIETPCHTLPLILFNLLLFDVMALMYQSGRICQINIINSAIFGLLSIYCNFKITSKLVKQLAYEKRIEHEKNYDGLTMVYTKKYSEEMITNALNNNEKGCLIILDVDHFKHYNDTYGHIYGDHVLYRVAQGLKDNFRHDDIVGRFGGDEFIIYLHHCSLDNAKRKMEEYFASLPSLFDPSRPVTCSAGIAPVPKSPTTFETLVKQADHALYEAKKQGRSKACLYHK